MGNNSEQVKQKEMIIQYEGYEGINLDNFNIEQLRELNNIYQLATKRIEYGTINSNLSNLAPLSLDEMLSKSKEFMEKYFDLHDINIITLESVRNIIAEIPITATEEEIYKIITSRMEKKRIYDLGIKLTEGHAMYGKVIKPIIITENMQNIKDREMYFSHIEIGAGLNLLSTGTLVHEFAHIEQENNIGYAKDYLNKEIISIFLEKVNALEMDPSGNLLKLSERIRYTDLLVRYKTCIANSSKLTQVEKIDSLMYIKSTLYAEKLFDMYLSERKFKNKAKYFTHIQKVFDGRITVEDLIGEYHINNENCKELTMLKRHL